MLKRGRAAALTVLVLLISTLPIAAARAQAADKGGSADYVAGRALVGAKTNGKSRAREAIKARGGKILEYSADGRFFVVKTPGAVPDFVTQMKNSGSVRYVEPDYILHADLTPNDPRYDELYGMQKIGAPAAWDVRTGSTDVVVGVIDSGVDYNHEDLAANMWRHPTTGQYGYDCRNEDTNPMDDHGHGTHVAGTIGGVGNNGKGVVGVNWTVKIMALKFLSASGSGSTSDAVQCIYWARDNGADMTNNSWGGGGFSTALYDAIAANRDADMLFLAAAGNDGVDTDSSPHYPSSYDLDNIISVAATDSSDSMTSWSNYGATTVDLAAPGASILSTLPGNKYEAWSGTSMATPHVAGAAALVEAQHPDATYAGTKTLLFSMVDQLTSLSGNVLTGGRLNVAGPVACSNTPKVWFEAPAEGFSASVGEALTVKFTASNCASTTGLTSVTAAATSSGTTTEVALTASGGGAYTGSYTPSATGPLTITATASNSTSSTNESVSGTVTSNYAVSDDTFAWIDATTGTNAGVTGDDQSKEIPLPENFAFELYGQSYTTVHVSSNGFLTFGGSSSAYSNTAMSSAPNGMVAPFWDDLNPQQGGAVYYKTDGTTTGSRSFVVEWNNIPHYNKVGNSTFQVVLKEGSNDILFQYKDVNFGNSSYDYGASATVGIKSGDGAMYKQFSYNQAVLQPYENQKSIRFSSSAPVDDIAPTVTSVTPLENSTDVPQTTTVSATFSEAMDPASVASAFTLSDGTAAVTGSVTYDAGTATFTPDATLASSMTYTATVSTAAMDVAGNALASAKTWSFTTAAPDTTPPDTTLDSTPASLSNSSSATFGFSSTDPTATFECSLDSSAFAACTSSHTYDNVTDGSHTFSVRAKDPAGNVDETPESWTWTVDTTAPGATITSGPSSPTTATSASFEFSSSDTSATFECKLDSQSYSACSTGVGYSSLSEGSHTFSVQAMDAAGNVGAAATWTWTVDLTAPTTTITSGPSSPSSSTSASFEFSANETATFECSVDSSAFAACVSPHALDNLTDGEHTFAVRATDQVGNVGTAATWTWTIDTSAPAVTSMHVYDLDQTTQSLRGGKWTATVDIYIYDNNLDPVADATATFKWTDGYSGTGTCVTNASGKCLMTDGRSPTTPAMSKGASKVVTLIVSDVTTTSGLAFVKAPNPDPDRDLDPANDSNNQAWSDDPACTTACRPYITVAKPN